MNSKQGTRYIKNRLGNDLKEKILQYNGIVSENGTKKKNSIIDCPRCEFVNNAIKNKYCSKCSYPLKPEAYDEIKTAEDKRMKILEENQKQKDEQIQNIQSQMNVLVEIISKLDDEEGKNKIAKQLIKNGLFTK
jgi:ribosomal protein L37E